MSTGPDLSEFESYIGRNHQNRCKLGRSLDMLNDEEQELFQAALRATHLTTRALEKWLSKRGLRLSESTVKKHREGSCCCER